MNFYLSVTVPVLATLLVCGCASRPRQQATSKVTLPPPLLEPRNKVPQQAANLSLTSAHRFYTAKDFSKAFDYYISAANQLKSQPQEIEAKLGAFRSAYKLGRWSEVLALSNEIPLLPAGRLSPEQQVELRKGQLAALEASADYIKFYETGRALLDDPSIPLAEKDLFKQKVFEMVSARMNQGELESFEELNSWPEVRAQASARLGDIALEARDVSSASSWYQKSMQQAPDSEGGRRAKDALDQLEALRRVDSKTIGVVLPLTGKQASIAQKTLRGIQLGLGLNGKQVSSFRLAVVDDESSPDRARRGVDRLVKEDNVIGIVGSLVSKTASAVAAKSAELGVPSVGLSQKSGLTDIDARVFRNALTSEMQVRALVQHAMVDLGMRRFAIMFPNDSYGVEFANLFWDEVLARGGQITAAQSYSTKEVDYRFVVQRLVGTFYTTAREDEYRLRSKELAETSKTKSVRNEDSPDDLLPPLVDFEAIFIPDSIKSLGQISAMLSFHGVKDVRLLGTNIWNNPGLSKRVGNWGKDVIIVDSFVSGMSSYQNSQFVKEYRALYGEDPGIFEMQGYDSAMLLRTLILQGASSRESLGVALASASGIPGSLSPLTMSPEREIVRPVTTLGIDNGSIVPWVEITRPK